MFADDLDAWALRLETIGLPPSVIAAEARDLAVIARQEHEKYQDAVAERVAADEKEIADRDATIAALREVLTPQQRKAFDKTATKEDDAS